MQILSKLQDFPDKHVKEDPSEIAQASGVLALGHCAPLEKGFCMPSSNQHHWDKASPIATGLAMQCQWQNSSRPRSASQGRLRFPLRGSTPTFRRRNSWAARGSTGSAAAATHSAWPKERCTKPLGCCGGRCRASGQPIRRTPCQGAAQSGIHPPQTDWPFARHENSGQINRTASQSAFGKEAGDKSSPKGFSCHWNQAPEITWASKLTETKKCQGGLPAPVLTGIPQVNRVKVKPATCWSWSDKFSVHTFCLLGLRHAPWISIDNAVNPCPNSAVNPRQFLNAPGTANPRKGAVNARFRAWAQGLDPKRHH